MDKLIRKINTSPLIRRRVISGDATQTFPKTFGVPLKTLIERDGFIKVPRVLTNICDFLLHNGLETEGIFRVNGNSKAIESIKLLFQDNYSLDMSNYTDVYAVASVLKLFLRELPNGVIPERIALQLSETYKHNFNNWEACLKVFRTLLSSLNEENYNLLKYLCHFLTKVAEKEDFNKMNCVNLGIVFGPNVFQSSQDMEGLKLQTSFNNVMTVFVSQYNQIFKQNSVSHQRGTPSHLCVDNTVVTQILSPEGHKSSPSLSGDFDLSSSNDNQLLPADLPPRISSRLHQVIMNCVDSHLTVLPCTDELGHIGSRLDVTNDCDLQMSRTSSLPHSIFKCSYDIPSGHNESNDFSLKHDIEPTAPPRSNAMFNGRKATSNTRNANRKPLLATQDSWNDIIDRKDAPNFNYSQKHLENSDLIDDMIPDWQCQNNLIDLDDFDGDDYLMNEMKENSLKNQIPNLMDHSNVPDRTNNINYGDSTDRKVNILELHERNRYLRTKLKEFEENFECLHGCRPPSIEKTGNTQVQEWLAELVQLREQLNLHDAGNNSENISQDFALNRNCHKAPIQDNNPKILSNIQSGTSTLSGVSDRVANKMKGITNLDNLNIQNISVPQFLEQLNLAMDSQRRRAQRPEVLREMSKEQYEEEKIDLQKCLLHFEKNFGRPKDHDTKQIMKPLYDRYRLVKRCIKSPENDYKPSTNLTACQTNGEYGHSSTSLSFKPKGFLKSNEENTDYGESTSKKDHIISTTGYEINHQMSHSFTTGSDDRAIYRKPTSNTGSLRSSGSQEHINKCPVSQNSSTTQRVTSSDGLCQRANYGANVKLKFQPPTVPQSSDNTTFPNTPLHSIYSTKSFTSSGEDIIPFRSCNTMTKTEIETEKDNLLVEKRSLQKLLKDFEHGLEKQTGHKVEKSDRDRMRTEYDRYKTIKCRLRILEKELE